MNSIIQTLAEICRTHPFEEKVLFVPSYSIGHHIGEHLARAGTSWINLRWTTTSGYALGLASLEMASGHIRLIDEQARLIIIEQLIRGREHPLIYFAKAAETPGIISSLAKAVHELRMAGFTAESLNPEAFIVEEKGKELIWLLSAYEGHLRDKRLVDPPGLLRMAIQQLEKNMRRTHHAVFMVLSDFPLTELDKRLMRTAGGDALVVIDHARPAGLPEPRRFFPCISKEEVISAEPRSNLDLLRWIFEPQSAPAPFDDDSVSLYQALGESNEVREALRRILSAEVPFDKVEMIVTKTDPYFPLIYEMCESLGIPVTFTGGLPVTYTRPGRALLLYLQWQAGDFQDKHLRAMLGSGLLAMDRFEFEGARPDEDEAVDLIREAGIGWGRERSLSRLDVMVDELRKKTEARGEKPRFQNVLWLRDLMRALLKIVPGNGPHETISTEDLHRSALLFLEEFCRVAGEMDASAQAALTNLLQSLLEGEPMTLPVEEAAERLRTAVTSLSIFHRIPRPGHLHVAHYRSAGSSGRSHTFVLGLSQDSFPGALHQDPVLLDVECSALGSGLPQSGDLLGENVYIMAELLCSRQGSVSLSHSCRDLADDREQFPASILLGAYRVITGKYGDDYSALIQYMKKPAGFVPGPDVMPLNDWEWWLGQRKLPYTSESVHSSYPHLQEGDRAEAARQKILLSEYDGLIHSIGEGSDALSEGEVLSCSRLEDLARCPFRFFLQHKLRLEPLEGLDKDYGRWLDPLQRGSLLHAILCRFMESLKPLGQRPSLKDHLKQMEEIARDEIERLKKDIPCASELVLEKEAAEMMEALPIFLRDEEERCRDIEPVYFELSFGSGDDEPVLIRVGEKGSFRLRGRIDRIDRCGEHDYEVWDYKSGSISSYKEHGYVDGGRQLQHALYAVAAETILRRDHDPHARVVLGGYFFPTVRGEGRRIARKVKRALLDEALEPLFHLLRSGIFPPSYDRRQCTYCDFVRVCGGGEMPVERCNEKLKTDPILEPFHRLKDCE